MAAKERVRAAVYVRLSRDADGLSTSTADQERECRELAQRRGWEVALVFRDNDIPASEAQATRKRKRPGYAALLKTLEQSEVDAVVVWASDRLYRHPRDLEDLIVLLEQRSVPVETCRSGVIDLATPDGRMMARALAAVNKREVEVLGDRVKRKAASNARAGKPHGGGRGFGYAIDGVTIIEEESEAIRDAASRLLNGESLTSVTALWNARGLRTTKANPWKPQVVGRLLKSPRIAGLREHLGEVYPAVWDPILDRRTWKRLRDHLADPRRVSQPTRGKYLLTNLLVCGECGAKINGQPVRGIPAYACLRTHGGCNRVRIMAEPLEEEVCRRASEVMLVKERTVSDPGKVEKRLTKAMDVEEAKLAKLALDHYDRGIIGDIEYQAAAIPIRKRLAALEADLSQVPSPPHKSYSALWKELQSIPDTWGEYIADPEVRADVRGDLERKVDRIVVLKAGKNGRWAKRPRMPKIRKDGKPSLHKDGSPMMVPVGPSRQSSPSNRISITWRQGVVERDLRPPCSR